MACVLPLITEVTKKLPGHSYVDANGNTCLLTPTIARRCHSTKVDRTAKFRRAGVIPVTFNGTSFDYCLAVDRKSGDLTDFGGSIERLETPLQGALRELAEESAGIFDLTEHIDDIYHTSFAVYDNLRRIVYFVLVDVDMAKTIADFNTTKEAYGENSDIVWLSEENFIEACNGTSKEYHMYSAITPMLSAVGGLIGE
jgi:hypothetical protein